MTTEKPIEEEKLQVFNELNHKGFSIKRIAAILNRNSTAISNVKIGKAAFSSKIKLELNAILKAIKELEDVPNTKEGDDNLSKRVREILLLSENKTTIKEQIIKLEAVIEEKEKQIENLTSIIKLMSNNLK